MISQDLQEPDNTHRKSPSLILARANRIIPPTCGFGDSLFFRITYIVVSINWYKLARSVMKVNVSEFRLNFAVSE